jgi:hypothetical protein
MNKARMAMAFIETDFFGKKTVACLERIRKENPRLRVILFAVTTLEREYSPGRRVPGHTFPGGITMPGF